MSPQALQTREHVAVLGKFHLSLCLCRLRTHGEDVEDETRAVENLHLQFALYDAELLWRKLIVEDHHAHLLIRCAVDVHLLFLRPLGAVLHIFLYLLQLALSHIGGRVGVVDFLGETLHYSRPCRVGKKLQFVQIFRGLVLVLLWSDETHEHSSFSLYFRYYEFFHYIIAIL